ncbi:MAG: hypothetical protein ABJL86_13400 [Gilvibacter sp.]
MDFTKLWQLMGFAIKRPMAMIQTFKATRECMRMCDAEYGRSHHLHNRANAVRHALWNFLIAQKVTGSKDKIMAAVAWAEKITNWHEEFSVNMTTEKAMDLHNNKIGRNLFVTLPTKTATYVMGYLQELATKAIQINAPEDITASETRLVFISEEHV